MAESARSNENASGPGPRIPHFREPLQRPWIWAVYVVLFGASVPWYLPAEDGVRLWFGLPHWVVISIGASLGVAIFTAFVTIRHWAEPETAAEPAKRDVA